MRCPVFLTAKASKEEQLVLEMKNLSGGESQEVAADSEVMANWAVDLRGKGLGEGSRVQIQGLTMAVQYETSR